jgi:chemotaxis protein methyltransferase CheR
MEYYQVLERDAEEFAAFLDRMTINVSELFRNPEKWQELRDTVLTPLLTRKRALKVWSAGCSYGAEPYTLAILLQELAPGARHTIHATDLDQKILARARQGCFSVADVGNMDEAMRERYLLRLPEAGGQIQPAYQVKPEIRACVSFRAQNLLADVFESEYDLICCRNVVIYFTEEAKNKLFARFYQALAPGGVLFVGGTERIYNYRDLGFETPLPFFYRRAA